MAAVCLLTAGFMAQNHAVAQLTYSSGQGVSPSFDGWEPNPDGSFNMVFGYMNQNWEEEIDAPIGAGNNNAPGAPDQRQPTQLYPRRNRYVFTRFGCRKRFRRKRTCLDPDRSRHYKEEAHATLKQDFFIDNMVRSSETGALGPGVSDPETRANKPPTVESVGEAVRTVSVGQPLILYAFVKDDGVPRPRREANFGRSGQQISDLRMNPPRRITVGSATGLWASLLKYRGAGNVSFEKDQIKAWEDTRAGANSQWAPLWAPPPPPPDGKWSATVTFDEPGDYVMRWHASDGALTADQDIKVTVTK